MSNTPAISVIMSVYNGEDYLKEAIESVLNQTFKNFELIIVNDCSTDNSPQILNDFALKDDRVHIITNEVNLKLPASLNKAVSNARGEYIARIDSDDIALPKRLELQYKFMKENPDVLLSSCRFMTLKGDVISSGGCGGRCDNDYVQALLLVTNPILHPGVIAKREVVNTLQYDTSLTCSEDLKLWTMFSQKGFKIKIQPEYLMLYRLHDKQITSTTLLRQHTEVLKIQNDYYSSVLKVMSEEMQKFYINGIYFRENPDIDKFCEFYKFLMAENKKTKTFKSKAIRYALLEILSEYKRCGIEKSKLLKAVMCLNPIYALTEMIIRKFRAYSDGKKCIKAAREIGLKRTGGTMAFPIFSK